MVAVVKLKYFMDDGCNKTDKNTTGKHYSKATDQVLHKLQVGIIQVLVVDQRTAKKLKFFSRIKYRKFDGLRYSFAATAKDYSIVDNKKQTCQYHPIASPSNGSDCEN